MHAAGQRWLNDVVGSLDNHLHAIPDFHGRYLIAVPFTGNILYLFNNCARTFTATHTVRRPYHCWFYATFPARLPDLGTTRAGAVCVYLPLQRLTPPAATLILHGLTGWTCTWDQVLRFNTLPPVQRLYRMPYRGLCSGRRWTQDHCNVTRQVTMQLPDSQTPPLTRLRCPPRS